MCTPALARLHVVRDVYAYVVSPLLCLSDVVFSVVFACEVKYSIRYFLLLYRTLGLFVLPRLLLLLVSITFACRCVLVDNRMLCRLRDTVTLARPVCWCLVRFDVVDMHLDILRSMQCHPRKHGCVCG